MNANAQERIDQFFNTKWHFEDFVFAYLDANRIEDTDENFEKAEQIVATKLTNKFLEGMKSTIIESINERLIIAMGE